MAMRRRSDSPLFEAILSRALHTPPSSHKTLTFVFPAHFMFPLHCITLQCIGWGGYVGSICIAVRSDKHPSCKRQKVTGDKRQQGSGDGVARRRRSFVRANFRSRCVFLLAYFLDLVFMLSLLVILLFSFFYSSILDNKMQTSAARAAREA